MWQAPQDLLLSGNIQIGGETKPNEIGLPIRGWPPIGDALIPFQHFGDCLGVRLRRSPESLPQRNYWKTPGLPIVWLPAMNHDSR
jgi:hypothetical protein